MNNAGVYTLAALGITAALTSAAQTAIDDLDGMASASLVADFRYGSGGSTAVAVVQVTLDGTTWCDVARFDFTTASATKWCVLQGNAAKAVAAYAALSAEGVNDGLLGPSMRAVITTTGTYANTTLAVRAAVR
jgi:hypothetical protein